MSGKLNWPAKLVPSKQACTEKGFPPHACTRKLCICALCQHGELHRVQEFSEFSLGQGNAACTQCSGAPVATDGRSEGPLGCSL